MFRKVWHQYRWLQWGLMLWAIAGSPAESLAAPPPVEDFTRAPAIGEVAISPSGTRLALAVPAPNGRVQLAVMSLDPLGPAKAVTAVANADIFHIRWVNDERLVFRAYEPDAPADRSFAGVFAVNYDGSEFRQLIARVWRMGETGSSIRSRVLNWQWNLYRTIDDGSSDVIVSQSVFDGLADSPRDERSILLSRLNTRTGTVRSLSEGVPDGTKEWVLDDQGQPRFVTAYRDGKRSIHWWAEGEKAWMQVAQFPAYTQEGFQPWHVDPQGPVYVLSTSGHDTQALHRFDPATKRMEPEPLVTLRDFDLAPTAEIDVPSHRLLGLHFLAEQAGSYWFDKDMRKLQQSIDAALPADRTNLIYCGRCASTRFLVVKSSSDRQPGEYYFFDRKELKLQRVGFARPWLKEDAQGTRSFHRVAARDGLPLPVYLTRPAAAKEGEQLPAVVLVHGGPFVRGHNLQWDAEAQFLASRGYLVIETEYRGSTGYGFRHFRAGWKQWGQAMQDDLADAVAWAVQRRLVDPKRVCIVGGSYGGYAALMGPIRNPGVYQCAVSYAGVTDIGLMYSIAWSDLGEEWKRYGMPELIGDPKEESERVTAASPLRQASRIKVPVMLAHGGLDRRVPIDHSRKFRSEAERAGVKVEWVAYADEGHGFVNPAHRADFWRRMENFLSRSIGSEPATSR